MSSDKTPNAAPVHGIVMLRRDDFDKFRITLTERTEVTINGTVEAVTVWETSGGVAAEFEHYLSFYMKWDGCCHLWMGQPGCGGKEQDGVGYFHLCGAGCWEDHIFLMRELWKWAAGEIPMDETLEPRELAT